MVAVEKLHDVKAAAVHIEMNVPLLKIRRDSFPDGNLRMELFHRAPRGITDAESVHSTLTQKRLRAVKEGSDGWNNVLHELRVAESHLTK